ERQSISVREQRVVCEGRVEVRDRERPGVARGVPLEAHRHSDRGGIDLVDLQEHLMRVTALRGRRQPCGDRIRLVGDGNVRALTLCYLERCEAVTTTALDQSLLIPRRLPRDRNELFERAYSFRPVRYASSIALELVEERSAIERLVEVV